MFGGLRNRPLHFIDVIGGYSGRGFVALRNLDKLGSGLAQCDEILTREGVLPLVMVSPNRYADPESSW